MQKHLPALLVLLALSIFSTPADAHKQEKRKHVEPVKAYHGGLAQEAGPYHLELIAKDGELVLYVADHDDKAVSTAGGKAKATIQRGYEKTSRVEVELQPAGDNLLKGTGTFTITQDTKIMVFIKLPDHEAHAASFSPSGTKSSSPQH